MYAYNTKSNHPTTVRTTSTSSRVYVVVYRARYASALTTIAVLRYVRTYTERTMPSPAEYGRVSQGLSIDMCFPQVSCRGRPFSRRVMWGQCHCNQSLNCLSFFCILVAIYGLLFFSCDLYDNIELESCF